MIVIVELFMALPCSESIMTHELHVTEGPRFTEL